MTSKRCEYLGYHPKMVALYYNISEQPLSIWYATIKYWSLKPINFGYNQFKTGYFLMSSVITSLLPNGNWSN